MTHAELRILALAVLAAFIALVFSSCETAKPRITRSLPSYEPRIAKSDFQSVRTTAYTHSERGGRHNAVGVRLSGANVMSAAADWSRFPVGTRFQIVGTSDRGCRRKHEHDGRDGSPHERRLARTAGCRLTARSAPSRRLLPGSILPTIGAKQAARSVANSLGKCQTDVRQRDGVVFLPSPWTHVD